MSGINQKIERHSKLQTLRKMEGQRIKIPR